MKLWPVVTGGALALYLLAWAAPPVTWFLAPLLLIGIHRLQQKGHQ